MTGAAARGERVAFLVWLAGKEGVPYLWGGRGEQLSDGRPALYEGYDCWGLVACGLLAAGGPDFRAWWTDRAWVELESVANPVPGDLVLYAPAAPRDAQDVEHVEVVMGPAAPMQLAGGGFLPGWRTLGAIGGGNSTTSLVAAQRQQARVKYRAHHLTRPRVAGFRRLPLFG